jgi:hypothetical protein
MSSDEIQIFVVIVTVFRTLDVFRLNSIRSEGAVEYMPTYRKLSKMQTISQRPEAQMSSTNQVAFNCIAARILLLIALARRENVMTETTNFRQ